MPIRRNGTHMGNVGVDSDDRIDFSKPDSFRTVGILLGDGSRYYVNDWYMRSWSKKFGEILAIAHATELNNNRQQLQSLSLDYDSPASPSTQLPNISSTTPLHPAVVDFATPLVPPSIDPATTSSASINPSANNLAVIPVFRPSRDDTLMLLEVIYAQRIIRNMKDLLPLMRSAVYYGCTALAQAVCVVVVMKIRELKDADVEQRRRLIPLLLKTLSHYRGEYLNGMYPAVLAPCTRHDIETVINDRDFLRGENSDLPWLMLEHYIRAVQSSQNRAMDLLGKQWDYDTLQKFLKLTKNCQTPEIIDHFELFFRLKLSDGVLQVNRNTLLSVSSVFRSLSNWQEQDESEINALAGCEEQKFIELPDDSITDFSPQLALMLSPSVYGCLWRIMPISDFIREHYLAEASTDHIMAMFRLADKYNMVGLLSFYAEALMLDGTISLMDKVVLADSCYRVQFLDMCFEDTLELAQLIRDPEHQPDWEIISQKTKERLMQRLADAVIRNESPGPQERVDPQGSEGTVAHGVIVQATAPMHSANVSVNVRGVPMGARRRVPVPLVSRNRPTRSVGRLGNAQQWEANDPRVRILRNLQARNPVSLRRMRPEFPYDSGNAGESSRDDDAGMGVDVRVRGGLANGRVAGEARQASNVGVAARMMMFGEGDDSSDTEDPAMAGEDAEGHQHDPANLSDLLNRNHRRASAQLVEDPAVVNGRNHGVRLAQPDDSDADGDQQQSPPIAADDVSQMWRSLWHNNPAMPRNLSEDSD